MFPSLSPTYPPAAFYFSVNVGSVPNPLDSSFRDVSGLEQTMEVDELREGGENRNVYQLPRGVKQSKLSLKRGVAPLTSPLVIWCKAILEGGLSTNITPQSVIVALLNTQLTALRVWHFSNAFPVRWDIEAFNSLRNEVAIEQIDLAYLSATRVL